MLLANSLGSHGKERDFVKLSRREEEVILLVAAGCRDREIAERLTIGTETVKTHLKRITLKLGSRTRAMAVARFTLVRPESVTRAFTLRAQETSYL